MTPLELKVAFRVMQEEMTALRDRVGALEAQLVHPQVVVEMPKPVDTGRKMCPHCNEKPAHFFHVKNCPANKKNKGSNGEVIRD